MAACQSNSGKTTVTLAVMATLRAAGLQVAPFKAGPDFIDPQWHTALCHRPSYTLDTCMVGQQESRAVLLNKQQQADIAVVEGVMGLYDGKQGVGETGSTADLARILGLPVVLVVNAKGMAGSIAPMVAGFTQFAQGFQIVGVIANRVGSLGHAQILRQALQTYHLPPLLGWLSHQPEIALGERHLGLLLPQDQATPATETLIQALTLDTEKLLEAISLSPSPPAPPSSPLPAQPVSPLLAGKQIAIARDHAFCFLYPANLEWLTEQGASLHFFSPLAGEPLPHESDALWFPGGYPELHAATLTLSPTWSSLRPAIEAGLPVLAECGGMMALGTTLTDHEGTGWPMAGLLPIHTRMTKRLAGLGYRHDQSGVRGHAFHHSVRDPSPLEPAFQVDRGDNGVRWLQIRASYTHWYFPSQPVAVARWLGRINTDPN